MIHPTEQPYIVRVDGILGGEPVIKDTRTSVRAIVEYRRLGLVPEQIIEALPHLTLAQVYDALSYYYDHQAEIDEYIRRNSIPEELVHPSVKGMIAPKYHLRKLPDMSLLLSGRTPPDDFGFPSNRLQIWYNNTQEGWADPKPHYHKDSDEIFVILRGSMLVEVEGERFVLGEREFCCFPAGTWHAVIEVYPPLESLMIRAPSIQDKVYAE